MRRKLSICARLPTVDERAAMASPTAPLYVIFPCRGPLQPCQDEISQLFHMKILLNKKRQPLVMIIFAPQIFASLKCLFISYEEYIQIENDYKEGQPQKVSSSNGGTTKTMFPIY